MTGASKELLETEVKPWIEAFLATRGLQLSAAKTRIVHIDEGFDFLGWNFRMYSGKLLIKPSKKNVQAFYDKLRKSIGNHLTVKQEELIGLLNPMLRGWAQYHRHAVAKQTFARWSRCCIGGCGHGPNADIPKERPVDTPEILALRGRS